MSAAMPLSTIIALARAGALDHAWAQFAAAGYGRMDADPAVLTVKGRLIKDHALRATDEATARRYYLQSADCYRASAALQPATYPLINAATLSLLAGDQRQAAEIAQEVLVRVASEPDEPETPYYKAATEAEALLLLGRRGEARALLKAAVAAAPRAWEDHASTLRQFLAIERMLGGDTAWLGLLRPPRSLHYVADKDTGPDGAGAVLDPDVGFGFGALAAGPELKMAEALLAHGAELHVILPSDADSFAARFIDPHGPAWRARFDRALAAAETTHFVRPLGGAPDAEAVLLADRIARGAAILNANRLLGEVIVGSSASLPAAPGLALLAIQPGRGTGSDFGDRLAAVRDALDAEGDPVIAPSLAGETILVGYGGCDAAVAAARGVHARLRDRLPLKIAAHHGLIDRVHDPFSGADCPTGTGADIVEAIATAAPPGSICLSDDFAAVLASDATIDAYPSRIGEIAAYDRGPAIGLYALDLSAPS